MLRWNTPVVRLLAFALVPSLGCQIVETTANSNHPDSGVTCSADAGLGSASMSGPSSFAVQAAYESIQVWSSFRLDGGMWSPDAGADFLHAMEIGLYDRPIACQPPALPASPSSLVILLAAPNEDFQPGTYLLPADGGLGALAILSLDGGVSTAAMSGSVQLTSVPACSLAGTYSFTFASADGGAGPTLSGSMSPVYCP